MRVTRRRQETSIYWQRRWTSLEVDEPMSNETAYPLVFALRAINSGDTVLEAGCGNGRLLRALNQRGYDVYGCDYIREAVQAVNRLGEALSVEVADVRNLPYRSSTFDVVLAFGVIHGLESGVERALGEFVRVLRPGGRLVVSARADTINTRISDYLWKVRNRSFRNLRFHKFNLEENEFVKLLVDSGLSVNRLDAATNVPLAYRIPWFRAEGLGFNEEVSRANGYQLNKAGRGLQYLVNRIVNNESHNMWVAEAIKPTFTKD